MNIKFPGEFFSTPMNPILVACLRDEGVNARLFGPRPHGNGVSIQDNETTYRIILEGDTLHIGTDEDHGKYPGAPTKFTLDNTTEFHLSDPTCFKKIKEYIHARRHH